MERRMELNLLKDIWEKRIKMLSSFQINLVQPPERPSQVPCTGEGAAPSETGPTIFNL